MTDSVADSWKSVRHVRWDGSTPLQDKEQKEEAKPGADQTANKDAEMPEQKEEAKNGEQADQRDIPSTKSTST